MTNLQQRLQNLSPEKRELLLQKLRQQQRTATAGKEGHVPPIKRISRERAIPLSFPQQQLWLLAELHPEQPVYNETIAIHMDGKINTAVLERSLTELLRRHEILRTTFAVKDGQPIQVIHPPSPFKLPVVDLCGLPETEGEAEALRLATEELKQPFDLIQGPLLRATLMRLGEADYRLFIAVHHIVVDGISMYSIFLPELETLYTAFSQGKLSPLPELNVQYADFAAWQRQWLQGKVLSDQLAYWKEKLSGLPTLQLPTDRPHSSKANFQGERQCLALSKRLTEQLKVLSRQEGVTLFMTLVAAIKILLYRYSAQEDIALGTVIAERNRPELEGVMGHFLNTLVLRTDLSGDPSFRELLRRVREITLEAYAHQDLPFEQLVAALQPERRVSQNPLFQVIFTIEPPLPEHKLNWTLSQLDIHAGTAKFDLTFGLDDRPEGIIGYIEYRTDLFAAATITRTIEHLRTLLEGIIANPEQRISELPLLTEAERHQLLVEWNQTQKDYPQDKCIHQLFEAQAERNPDAVAVVFEEQQLTYRQLNCRANQLARYLQTLGVEAEVLVGICTERSLEMLIGLLGILKAGGAYVPLDPSYPNERLAFMLNDSQMPVLLTQQKLLSKLPEHGAYVVCLDADWGVISLESKDNPVDGIKPSNLAYVIYTSGSTGKPKGVLVPHKGLLNLVFWHQRAFEVTSSDRATQLAGTAFDASVWELWPYLAAGARLYLVGSEFLNSPEHLRDWLVSKEIAISFLPTPLAERLLSLEWPESLALRIMLTGGDKLHQYPSASVLFKVVNNYGPTENTVVTTSGLVDDHGEKYLSPAIGRPIANTQVYILDRHLQPVPIGVPGELYIGGDGLARGYLNRPELTEKAFIPNPFLDEPGARLYKTGDLVRYRADGNIEFLGRLDYQVKIRGFRIELEEIEAVLDQHPRVSQTVVLAREDRPRDKRLVVYVVPEEPGLTPREIRSFLKEKLPNYMVPSAFVMLDALPLTPNGKVDRRALPAPALSRMDLEVGFVAPRDSLELKLAQIWSEVLDVYPVSVRDNFFDLGGHSLLAVRLMAEIQQQFEKNLSLATLFQSATIEQLAIILRENTDSQSWSPLVPIQPKGSKPPLFCVPGSGGNVVYFHELARHLGFDQPFYGLQARGLDGKSEPYACVEEVASHYIDAIQSIQPQEPYFLAGHSFGGCVVFEIAQQLQKKGQQVALLAILDIPAFIPSNKPSELDWDDAQWLTLIAFVLELLSRKNLGVSYEALQLLAPDEQLNYLKERLTMANLLPPETEIDLVRGIVQVIKANELAFLSYVAQGGYLGQITLFRTSEVYHDALGFPLNIPEDPTWGWGRLSPQPVDIHEVPGDHSTMITEPHVQVLAKQLKACIEQALD